MGASPILLTCDGPGSQVLPQHHRMRADQTNMISTEDEVLLYYFYRRLTFLKVLNSKSPIHSKGLKKVTKHNLEKGPFLVISHISTSWLLKNTQTYLNYNRYMFAGSVLFSIPHVEVT